MKAHSALLNKRDTCKEKGHNKKKKQNIFDIALISLPFSY